MRGRSRALDAARGGSLDLGIPHAEGSTSFGVRVVTNPECLVTVEAIDQVSQAPSAVLA